MQIYLFVLAFALAILSGRVVLVMVRGGMFSAVHNEPLWRGFLGALVLPCQIALIVWCFAQYPWYYAILGLVTIIMMAGLMVTNATLAPLHSLSPLINLITIACTISLWWYFYPL